MKIKKLNDFGFFYEGQTIHGMWFPNKANAEDTMLIQASLALIEIGEASIIGELAGVKVKESDYYAACNGSLPIQIAPEQIGGGYMILFPSCPIIKESQSSLSASSGNDGCFIATACYGSHYCDEVIILRNFRDSFLMHRKFGRFLVKSYYAISPTIARWIQSNQLLKKIIRNFVISPFVNLIK